MLLAPRRLQEIRLPKGDPTRTSTIVRAYQVDLDQRWRELRSVLRRMIAVDDILGLGSSARTVLQLTPPSRFDFPLDPAGKAAAFQRWLRGALDSEVLELVNGSASGWQNSYVRAAYSRGLEHAEATLRAGGLDVPEGGLRPTLAAPIHAEKLNLLFSRNFRELKGITDAVDQQLSRIVTEGLATGQSPREVARRITRGIDSIGRRRALTLARTETVRAHAESTLNRFQQAGVDAVSGKAEFVTAGDDRVCPQCEDLEGRIFLLDEARGIIPVHPNCRCTWLPVLASPNLGQTDPPFNPSEISTASQLAREAATGGSIRLLLANVRKSPRGLPLVTDDIVERANASLPKKVKLGQVKRAADAQESVELGRVLQIIRNERNPKPGTFDESGFRVETPVFFRHADGEIVILEGHHRVAAFNFAGRGTIRARVVEAGR